MSKLFIASLLLSASLVGCAMPPVVQSDVLGRHHAVTAASVQEGRAHAIAYCRRSDHLALLRHETVVDHGNRQSYVLAFSCGGYSPETHKGG